MSTFAISEAAQKELGLFVIGYKPKLDFHDPSRQETNPAGALKWRVTAGGDDGSVLEVTVTGAEPALVRAEPIWFPGLVVGGTANGLWFAAKAVVKVGADHE